MGSGNSGIAADREGNGIDTEDKAALMDSLIVCRFLRGVFEDFYAETAAMCDCPIGTIRSRVARARADLDAMLTQDSMADYSLGS